MRGPAPALLPLALFALLFALWPGGPGRPSAAQPDPAERLARAQELFAQGLYREAWEELEAVQAGDGVGERELAFWRGAAQLRWLDLQWPFRDGPEGRAGEFEAARAAMQELAATDPMDDWAARAAAELVRANGGDGGQLHRALGYWESLPDLERSTVHYHELLQALLHARRDHRAPGGHWLRMWENLVRSPLAREELLDVAGELMGLPADGGGPVPRSRRWMPRPWDAQLAPVVARDVLATPGAGAPLRASAHLVLGQEAEQQGDMRAAVAHYSSVLELMSPSDGNAAHHARQRLDALRQPTVSVSPAGTLHRPGSEPQLQLGWRNLRSWELRVVAVDPLAQLARPADQGYLARDGQVVHTLRGVDTQEEAARRDGAAGQAQPHAPRSETRRLPTLDRGLYALVLVGEPFEGGDTVEARAPLVVSRAEVVTSTGPDGELVAWVVDAQSGEPRAGARLALYREHQRKISREDARSGEGGLARFGRAAGHGQMLVGQAGPDPLWLPSPGGYASGRPEQDTQRVAWMLSDRPLYRPGEILRLWGVLRDRSAARRDVDLPPDGLRPWLELRSPDGQLLEERELSLDDHGQFDAEVELPATAALGSWTAVVRDRSGGHHLGQHSFQVDELRLPEFSVSVARSGSGPVVLGDTLQVEIHAQYLSGDPVVGSAEVVVERAPWQYWWPPVCRFPSFQGDGVPSRLPWPGPAPGEQVLRRSLSLDAEGRATLAIPTQHRSGERQDYQYTITAQVTDPGRREESGALRLPVSRQLAFARLVAPRVVARPGEALSLRAELRDAGEQGLDAAGHWWAERLMSGEDGDERAERVATGTVEVVEGEGRFDFAPPGPGQYRVAVEFEGPRGSRPSATTGVWAVEERGSVVEHRVDGLQLVVSQVEYTDEAAATVLVVSEHERPWVLLEHSHAGGAERELRRLRGNVARWEIPLTDRHRPAFAVRASVVRDWQLHQASARVVAPPVRAAAELELAFDDGELLPGATAKLRVRATGHGGQPLGGPVALAVIDRSILEVVPRPPVEPFAALWSFPPSWLGGTRSQSQGLGGYAEDEADDSGRRERSPERRDNSLGRQMPAASALEEGAMLEKSAMADMAAPGMGGDAQAPVLRQDFRTTALWRTGVLLDDEGKGEVEFTLPQTLTEWSALAVHIDRESRAGTAEASVRTRQPIMVRLNHPRVFREGDRFVLAATVRNEHERSTVASVRLEVPGLVVDAAGQTVELPAGGSARVEWTATAPPTLASLELVRDDETGVLRSVPSSVVMQVWVESELGGDAFERVVPALPFGVSLRVAASGVVETAGELRFELPSQRDASTQEATLSLAPTVLASCVPALAYLADYPYGCVEQTLSRFVPAAAVAAAVRALGGNPDDVDPELDEKVAQGLRRLQGMQKPDGSWGWWGDGPSDPYMTAYVVAGLAEARRAGLPLPANMLERGLAALRQLLPQVEEQDDTLAFALYAYAAAGGSARDEAVLRWASGLFERRDRLGDQARAQLALALHGLERPDDALLVARQLRSSAQENSRAGTAHWGRTSNWWWRGQGAVESTAFALRALLVTGAHAQSAELLSLADAAARWLVYNREGHRWDSTRSSAHSIFALVDYAREREQIGGEFAVVATLNGQEVARHRFGRANLLAGAVRLPLPGEALQDGANAIELRVEGEGRVYAGVAVEAWTEEPDPAPTAHRLAITRQLVKLVPVPTLGGSYVNVEEPLEPGDEVAPGDRIVVRLKLRADHDLEYVLVEDPRPAGCEPVERLSGFGHFGDGLHGRREVRDTHTAFFLSLLPEGEHTLEYELRAESPGEYGVVPARAYGMYLPDVGGSSRATRVEIVARR